MLIARTLMLATYALVKLVFLETGGNAWVSDQNETPERRCTDGN